MTQDLNQQFDNPELFSNQEPVIQPAESSLFELDLIPKANSPKMEMDESIKQDKTAKAVYEAVGPIEKEMKVGVYVDDKGNMYDEKSDEVRQSLMQMEFPDPPTEEEKKQRLQDIQTRMNNDIAALDAQAEEKFGTGFLGRKRKDKWIDIESKKIKKKYEDEYYQFVGEKTKDYTKKNRTEKDLLYVLTETGRKFQTKLNQTNSLISGIDPKKVSMHEKDNIDETFEEKFKETTAKGITTYEAFEDAFEKGKLEDGAIFRIEDDRGYKSNVRSKYSNPVYYRAFIDNEGNKKIEIAAQGVVDPLTGNVLGAEIPSINLSAVDINYDYSTITNFNTLESNINSRTDLSPEQKNSRIANLTERRNKNLGKLKSAYTSVMQDQSINKWTKLAVIASTYPNQFKEAYAQFSAETKEVETASDRVLKAFGGIIVSPITAVTKDIEVVEKGVTELSRLYQGKTEGVLPTGTLALEIKKNPDLPRFMDEVMKEAGERGGLYVNSVEGLANLVSAAKAKMNNKDIESLMNQARTAYPQILETLESFSNTAKKANVDISSYQSGILNILNTSGYNAALNDYKNALNALENNDNKDIRDAVKFIKYQSILLNTETPFSENLAKLKPEEIEFINTIGKDLKLNKPEILSMAYDEANKIYELGSRVKSLYPAAAIKEYEDKNKPALDQSISEYNQKEALLRNSEIFSEKGKFLLGRLNQIDDEYNSSFSDTRMYSFPMLSQDEQQMKNALAYINPLYGMGAGFINGIGDILSGLKETGQKLTGFSWDGFDANSRNISYSLGEYKRYLDTAVGKTGNYAFDIAANVGSAFPQMVGFAASFLAGGPVGGAGYLMATMTGPKMREAADAGLGDMGQATYAIVSMGLEYFAEGITPEASLLKASSTKSVLTKEIVEKIMAPKTRKEGFKEYARLLWKKGVGVGVQGSLEAFEEEVANKGNYILQSFYNGMLNTSFNPSTFTAQESADNLLTMIGTSVLFKGVLSLKGLMEGRTQIQDARQKFQKEGIDKLNASLMASLTTGEGVARALDIVKKVESGEIKQSELNVDIYERVRDVILPAALSTSFPSGASVQQKTVALNNMIKASELTQMVERGETTSAEATPLIQSLNENAQKALRDVNYANEQFGIDNSEMKSLIMEYFGVSDINTNSSGALDASTQQQIQKKEVEGKFAVDYMEVNDKGELVPTTQTFATSEEADAFMEERKRTGKFYGTAMSRRDVSPIDKKGMEQELSKIYVENEQNKTAAKTAEEAIKKNPEVFLASEINNANNLLEKAKSDYELASQQGPAPTELARIDDLKEKIDNLENIKSRYLNSVKDATQVSEILRQESRKPSDIVQRPGVEEGQPQEGQAEGAVGETTQPSPDTRNRNFGSQAQQAIQEITVLPNVPAEMQNIPEGGQVQALDAAAKQILTDENAALQTLGQPVVDRVKQWIADTGYTAPAATMAETAPVTEAAPAAPAKVEDLFELDTKEPSNLQKVINYLDNIDKAIGRELNSGKLSDATRVLPLIATRTIIKGVKALLEGGMRLKEAIAKVVEDFNLKSEDLKVTEKDVADAWNKIGEIEDIGLMAGMTEEQIKERQRQTRVNQIYSNPRIQGAVTIANTLAENLKKTEKSSLVAYQKVFSTVQKAIQKMYEAGGVPEAASAQTMIEITQSIARDAVNTAYPSAKKMSAQEMEQVTMSTRKYIGDLMRQQARAGAKISENVKAVRKAVNDIFKVMNSQLGKDLKYTDAEFRKITKEMEDAVFAKPFSEENIDAVAANVTSIIEKAYNRKVADFEKGVRPKIKELLDRLMATEMNRFGNVDAAAYSAFGKAIEYINENKKEFGIKDIQPDNVLAQELDKKINELGGQEKAAQTEAQVMGLFATPQARSLITSAQQMADKIVEDNKKEGAIKITPVQAYKNILSDLVKKIDAMYKRGDTPSGLTSIRMIDAASGIVRDAINAAFPTTSRIQDSDVQILSKSALLEKQIKDLARGAKDAMLAWKKASEALGKDIKDMARRGQITANQAANIIKKFGKVNMLNPKSIRNFVDYMTKVFNDAEYQDKLNEARKVKKAISRLAKGKDRAANLTDIAKKFLKIEPSDVEDIAEYNGIANQIKESLAGTKKTKEGLNIANIIDINSVAGYIQRVSAAQDAKSKEEANSDFEELSGVSPEELSYDEMIELLNSKDAIPKDKEKLIRAAANKAFETYSGYARRIVEKGVDPFTEDEVNLSETKKEVVRRFMKMDLNRLSTRQAIQAIDALNNFVTNKSIARMDAVASEYEGAFGAKEVKDKNIKSFKLKKWGIPSFGRIFSLYTTNLSELFTRMFKGVNRGAFVMTKTGVNDIMRGKATAEKQANDISKEYVDKMHERGKFGVMFKNVNGEEFNTLKNNVERGAVAYMSRNVIGTQEQRDKEFNRRKNHLKQSIDVLLKGTEREVKLGEVYKEIYDKLGIENATSAIEISGKADPKNIEGIEFWKDKWAGIFDDLAEVSEGIYNRVLGKDTDYIHDKYKRLDGIAEPDELGETGSAYHNNSGEIYVKETGVLMKAERPDNLPEGKYIDLSFDSNNASAMYDALIDINTASAIRKWKGFSESEEFKSNDIVNAEDKGLFRERMSMYIKKIRNKAPFVDDELEKGFRRLNTLTTVGAAQALGSVSAALKQTVSVMPNTLINSGSLDFKAVSDIDKNNFISRSGYGIANRGIASQAQLDSLNKIIEVAASGNTEKMLRVIERTSNFYLKTFLVNADAWIARISWLSYYQQSLKQQGIDPNTVDWKTHEVNKVAGDYAQLMLNRQQNISDPAEAGKLFANTENTFQKIIVKTAFPFSSFRLNQSTRLANDLGVLEYWSTATKEDRIVALRSLAGFAAEMVTFRSLSAFISIMLGYASYATSGQEPEEDQYERWIENIIRGQFTNTVNDIFSPLPVLDYFVQQGAFTLIEEIQNLSDIPEKEQVNIFEPKVKETLEGLGLLGITAQRAATVGDMVNLSMLDGSIEDNFGNLKYLQEEDKDLVKKLIIPALLGSIGLLPAEVNSVIRKTLNDAKKRAKTQRWFDLTEKQREREERLKERRELRKKRKEERGGAPSGTPSSSKRGQVINRGGSRSNVIKR